MTVSTSLPEPCACRRLRTVYRSCWLAFWVMLMRGIVLLGGYGALAGKVVDGRHHLGVRAGYPREVPGWFFGALRAYELAAFLGLLAGMAALFLYKRRPVCHQSLLS